MIENSRNTKTFEVVFSVILLAPILFFLFGTLFGSSLGFLFSLTGSLTFPFLISSVRFDRIYLRQIFNRQEVETFVFFFISLAGCLYFCLSWPDFISIGERLRDYALLASVKDFPLQAKEPWMTGANLNYYLYWYRFSAYWSTIFGLQTWTSYHITAAFSFSFFISCIFRLLRCYFNIPLFTASCFSLLIAFGSNISGIVSAFSGDDNWWGPSRVIEGTINEFPAWSFLLGDLHPHFLNLNLTLFISCLTFAISKVALSVYARIFLALLLFIVSAPLYYNTNAWEVPMAGITFSLIILISASGSISDIYGNIKNFFADIFSNFKNQTFISITSVLLICLISLLYSCRNIQPADYPWRWVSSPVEKSTWLELIKHWGIPFSLILAVLFSKISEQSKAAKSLFFMAAFSLAVSNTAVTLVLIALCILCIGIRQVSALSDFNQKTAISVLYSLGVSSLILIALGELVYLDDPYGGENERMNTIFKIYSACWAPLHIFAFTFCFFEFTGQKFRNLILIVAIACMPAFFANTYYLRKNYNPSAEGLESVDREFSGATDAVRYLRNMPRLVLLEAQGNPYSYTSFLSTLGGDDSYLGWANHVGLLTGLHEEVSRRENITTEIYNTTDCNKKRQLAQQEKIDMIAIGHLERKKYDQAGLNAFDCMTVQYNSKEHLFLKP